ncbi:hypothetical protein BDV23DRAFT_163866 [Aspergillus alliaceus]|uniref:Secreted protein n=1 Tax=Petromyces alliaceus TaxID=209559 RepID=A0A5N7BW85_PETAA|nr:hypothetical protein BDV23DRAFT_163866 [Aspergillus alliaceus]
MALTFLCQLGLCSIADAAPDRHSPSSPWDYFHFPVIRSLCSWHCSGEKHTNPLLRPDYVSRGLHVVSYYIG